MNLFKKPGFAVFLCIVLVIASTLISVHWKLGAKADKVTDGFYEGVYSNGYKQPSIASHLENISACADGLVTIARNYDIDTEDVEDANDSLKMSLDYSHGYASHIHSAYSELSKALNTLIDQLLRADLNERDASGVEQYANTIAGAQSSMADAGYNESVREFLRKFDRFPANFLAALSGVDMPEYFA